ncbi:formamidopyrimidine-DNA glycosylase [Marisediminicola sp. UYEF4]|uniref:bifunctional DNA-formamidopyrimidine glycosylase/DNA-(apurinic or apyrimidinic site) lyase n=1 Tax=Marisediminicola sp. UYEF4 TaxID=1756384 RepID=UPI003393C7FB
MPELPEVEVVRAGLEPAVTGATVSAVTVFDDRSLRRHAGPSEEFVWRMTGRTILGAVRRGKFLWLPLDAHPDAAAPAAAPDSDAARPDSDAAVPPAAPGHGEALVAHLGMSGQVLLRDRGTEDPLTRIRLELEHPVHGPLRLNFVDQRIFGSMAIDELVPTADSRAGGYSGAEIDGTAPWPAPLVPSKVAHIARDPLDPAFDDARFFTALARRNTGIKRALLDQSLVSGIGNIYADESLWAARIHFDQPTNRLTRPRAKLLLAEVRLVLGRALAEGGTSFDAQYVNVNGASGYFSHSLNAYGRHGRDCPRCGRPIIREAFMNRNSHFCAFCQRLR